MLEGELLSTGAAKQKIPSPFSQPWANPDYPRKGSWTIFRDMPEIPPQHEDQQEYGWTEHLLNLGKYNPLE